MNRYALLATAISVAGVCGCKPTSKEQLALKQTEEKPALVCAGFQITSDLKSKGSGAETRMTKYFVLEKDDLLEWDKNRGAPVPVCDGWGEGCYVRIFPLEIEMKAARSSEDKMEISIFREKGVVIYERREFDNLVVFSGKCQKGILPSINAIKTAV